MGAETKAELDGIESMFVQTKQRTVSVGERLTLEKLTPATLFFSDRPQRVVGHLGTADFVGLWGEGENSFAQDPPNAVLAFLFIDPLGRPLSPAQSPGWAVASDAVAAVASGSGSGRS